MSSYTVSYKLRSADVDLYRRLRLSTLFTMLQEAAIAHTQQLGAGREHTLDRGLLWVVTLQNLEISRLPEYDQTVELTSWPGETIHLYFPRHYVLRDEAGHTLVRGAALWALMDEKKRHIVFPEEYGIRIQGVRTGTELPLPAPPRLGSMEHTASFTVPFSYGDLNGHMNNTRYLDLIQDILPLSLTAQTPKGICVEYSGEIRVGETMELSYGCTDGAWSILGQSQRRLLRMKLSY